MSLLSSVAKLRSGLDAILRPSVSVAEYEIVQDKAQRDPQEIDPTKGEFAQGAKAVASMDVRVRRSRISRERMRNRLLADRARADAAEKKAVDFVSSPQTLEALERADKLRDETPKHLEHGNFRIVKAPAWMRILMESILIIADWGIWFYLLTSGLALTFTMPTSLTDPTPIYDPQWFVSNPVEWITAFVVPTFIALVTVLIGRLTGRQVAQRSAMRTHPERTDVTTIDVRTDEGKAARNAQHPVPYVLISLLVLLSGGLYFVAAAAFNVEAIDGRGWLIAAPWALIPLTVFLLERFRDDAVYEIDKLTFALERATRAKIQSLSLALMRAEDKWLRAWKKYDMLIRQILDNASADLGLYEQILMRAHSRAGHGMSLAPLATPEPANVVTVSQADPPRPTPVEITTQRGLQTKLGPWRLKQLQLDIQTLAENLPPIDIATARNARINEITKLQRS
ncbi:MAG: hypothetical protein KF772_04725 [Cryobacterium sp.]|nr:hypothetical protein [Cryobacterium sp.]